MEQLNFAFKKKRGIGELFSDYISLFKLIFKHFNKTILTIALPIVALFIILSFFLVGNLSAFMNFRGTGVVSPNLIVSIITTELLFALVFFLFTIIMNIFGIEYMFLLYKNGKTDFSTNDLIKNAKKNLGKYVLFFLASIPIMIILMIPIAIVAFILLFIPIIGQFGIIIIGSMVSLFFNCALFLYLEEKASLWGSFTESLNLISSKVFSYGLASFLFQFLSQILFGILSLIPLIILWIIAYNTVGFHPDFIITFGGKFFIGITGGIVSFFMLFFIIYLISFYVLEYFSLLESGLSEETLEDIENIGENV